MKKFRLIMTSVAILSVLAFLASWQVFLTNIKSSGLLILVTLVTRGTTPFLLLTSLTMLASSLAKVTSMNDQLEYDCKNFYWKIMSWLWSGSFKNQISSCKAFRLTCATIILGCLGVMAIILLGISSTNREVLLILSKIIGSTAILVAILLLYAKLVLKVGQKLGDKAALLLLTPLLVVLAYLSSLAGADLIHTQSRILGFIAFWLFVAIVSGFAVGLVVITDRFAKKIKSNTLLGLVFGYVKDTACPILVSKQLDS